MSRPDVRSTARLVVDLAESRPPTLGEARLVCIDGPAGSGKTTLARAVSRLSGARVVHMDALMEGWGGADGTGPQLEAIVGPLAAGTPGRYRRYSWARSRFDGRVEVPVGPWLVIEGVGSGNPVIASHVTVLVWVEVDDDLRLERGLARDGQHMEPYWRRFMPDERRIFRRDRTRARADVLVDGTGRRPPIARSGH